MMRVLSLVQMPSGDWLITFDGPNMRRVQVIHRGEVTPDVVRKVGDQLEPRMTKLAPERA